MKTTSRRQSKKPGFGSGGRKIDRSYTVPFRVVVTNCARWAVRDYLEVIYSLPDPTAETTELLDGELHEPDFDSHEARTTFLDWLAELGEPDQTIAGRCWLQGVSTKEVADEVGLSPGAVDTRKSRLASNFRRTFRP